MGLLLAMGPFMAQAAETPWWDKAWTARHEIRVQAAVPPTVDAVRVDMSTLGRLRADAGDLRVVTPRGKICPHEVVCVGPGERVRFLFRPESGVTTYHAYFGNRFAEPPREPYDRKAGLLIEVRDLPDGPFRRTPEILALWRGATEVQGRVLVSRVFHGSNPVGPEPRFIARYVGHVYVPAPGAYRIVTTSSDASAVLVDGRIVAQWGGEHNARAGRNGQFGSTVDLTPGLHRIEYYWVKSSTHPAAAVLGWQRPTELGARLVPPNAFVHPVDGKVMAVESRDGARVADFLCHPQHHIDRNGIHAVSCQLRRAAGQGGGEEDFVWEFPDGSTAHGKSVNKVFFGLGPREVKLTVPGPHGPIEGVREVDIQPVWTQTRPPKGKSFESYRHGFDEVDPDVASPAVLASMIAFADDLDRTDRIEVLWERLRARREARTLSGFALVVEILGARFQRAPFCSSDRAEEALRLGIASACEEATRLRCMRLLADLLVNVKGDADGARDVLDRLGNLRDDKVQRRLVRILEGDIAAQRGDLEEAVACYAKAGSTARPWDKRVAVRRDSLLFCAEGYLRRDRFAGAAEALEDWLVEQPSDRLEPHLLWLLARAYSGLGFHTRALVMFDRALGIDPCSSVAPRILLGRADHKRTSGDEEGALVDEEMLLGRFPYSEEAAQLHARRKGIQLEGGS